MDRRVRFPGVLATLALAAAPALVAQTSDPVRRERPVSPRVALMLAAAMPPYQPAAVAPAPPSPTPNNSILRLETASASTLPANTIVRLPEYIVRGSRLPTPEEVMSPSAKTSYALQKYLGDEDGLERAMNMFSVAGLWAKLPVVGRFPFIVGQFASRHSGLAEGPQTNEQRALAMYEKARLAERLEQLSGLLSPALRPAAEPPGK